MTIQTTLNQIVGDWTGFDIGSHVMCRPSLQIDEKHQSR